MRAKSIIRIKKFKKAVQKQKASEQEEGAAERDPGKERRDMNRKAYYGAFGGQYVAESLMNTLEELDAAFEEAIRDPEFLKQYHSLSGTVCRERDTAVLRGASQ